MLISYHWLRQLLPGLNLPVTEVANRLAAAGLAVDGIAQFGPPEQGLRIARVVEITKHPKRDNLQLVTVDTGGKPNTVVCGANNVPLPGGFAVLAELGVQLPGAQEPIQRREIGGIASEGMLCSEQELGLAENASGLFVVPTGKAAPGTPFVKAYPEASDWILELDITPNRPDALGHVGVARELAALLPLPPLTLTAGNPAQTAPGKPGDFIQIENRDPERCPIYRAGIVLGIHVGPSPDWLRWRLHSLGVRSISNVVDVTNLLLMEFAQPLHAFDLDRIDGARIVIRHATAGENFTTLDNVTRTLDGDDLLIGDARKPSALAGVMGGLHSEIQTDTRRVLLECAYFQPQAVRRSARRHGLHTESSHRFERGVDPAILPVVLERAKTLLTELAGGAAVAGQAINENPLPVRPPILLRGSRLNALLGTCIPFSEATCILERLGQKVTLLHSEPTGAQAEILPSSFRPDLQREVDLIEEVARVRGYDLIPARLPAIPPQPPRTTGQLEREVIQTALSLGLSEAVTLAFVSHLELDLLGAPTPTVTLQNPLSEARAVLRTSLLPGLFEALRRARRHGEDEFRLFSVGSCFLGLLPKPIHGARPRLESDVGLLPDEHLTFAAVLAGPRYEYLTPTPNHLDIYDLKGLAVEMVERLTRKGARVVANPEAAPYLHPRGAADLWVGRERKVGLFGPVHPDIIDRLELGGTALVLEIDLEAIDALGKTIPRFEPIPRLPAVTRDVSLVVGEEVQAGAVEYELKAANSALCESVHLVGLFQGGSVPAGKKSLTFRIVYRDPKSRSNLGEARTLTDAEVDTLQEQSIQSVRARFGAGLRE